MSQKSPLRMITNNLLI